MGSEDVGRPRTVVGRHDSVGGLIGGVLYPFEPLCRPQFGRGLRGMHARVAAELAAPRCGERAGATLLDVEERGRMTTTEVKSFDKPDETRLFEGKGHVEVVMLMGRPVGRGTFEPGWRWSTNVKPIAGTDMCQVSHLGYCAAGRMRI